MSKDDILELRRKLEALSTPFAQIVLRILKESLR